MSPAGKSTLGQLPSGIWVLGFVSLLMDISSEMIHSLLPLYLVGTLGASPLLLGLIEGIAEATASFMRLFSGAISDRLGRRKPLLLAGYGLAALSKPLFPLADSALTVMGARFLDRIGKGIRGAPRDALLADVTKQPWAYDFFALQAGDIRHRLPHVQLHLAISRYIIINGVASMHRIHQHSGMLPRAIVENRAERGAGPDPLNCLA